MLLFFKLFDLGFDGGDHELDGDVIAESDDISYECGAKQKYQLLFKEPVLIQVRNSSFIS